MNEFKPGSIEHRKKVIERYHIEDGQKILDMPYPKFEVFCIGLSIGEKYGGMKATYGVLKNPSVQQVIDMMYELSDEDRDKVLDEFCEPDPEIDDHQCDTCKYRYLDEEKEPCKGCINGPVDLWEAAE